MSKKQKTQMSDDPIGVRIAALPSAVRPAFPFSAVVGQEELALALVLAAMDPAIGGVLLRGEKGSAKTTMARGLANLLVGGAPFVELPIGATEDRLVGSFDLRAALTQGERRFAEGLLAAAHGGVLYVDEVNLLPDHLVDVLLDVASSGINRVERDGVSHVHASRFVLVGSMNPEEGELRPQLLDRFGLSVGITAPSDPALRAEAVRRRLAFDADPAGFTETWRAEEEAIGCRLAVAAPVPLAEGLLCEISALCAASGAEGLRADLVLCRAASALAGWEARAEATADDVRRVAGLALEHRRRRSPFEPPGLGTDELQSLLDGVFGAEDNDLGDGVEDRGTGGAEETRHNGAAPRVDAAGNGAASGVPDVAPDGQDEATNEGSAHLGCEPAPGDAPGTRTEVIPTGTPGQNVPAIGLGTMSTGRIAPAFGRRSTVTIDGGRGREIGARRPSPSGPIGKVAVRATVDEAVMRQSAAGADAEALDESDLREVVAQERTANLVILAVDASGSMGAKQRMAAAKGAVLALLVDAYQRRDRVALVTFRGEEAEVVLRPTGSVEVAEARLAALPTGGRTPLAAGILAAAEVAKSSGDAYRPLLVVVTDGRATVAPGGADPLAASVSAAESVRRAGFSAVVIDAEGTGGSAGVRLGLAWALADAMGARYLTVSDLTAETLLDAMVQTLPVRASGS